VKVLVIGCGSIGMRHVQNLRDLGHEVRVLDTDLSKVLAAARLGARPAFTTSDVDAALICTPAATHGAVAEQLLRDGYMGALFVEKPLDVRSLSIFRLWPHPVTMVGYNWRFHPAVRPLLQLRPDTLHLACHTQIARWPGHAYGEPLLECSHEVDLAVAWRGEVLSLHGGALDGGAGAWVHMQHAGGDSIVDVLWDRPPRRRLTARYRDGARLEMDLSSAADSPGLIESYKAEIRHFLEAVRTGRPTECPFAQGLRVIEICEQVRKVAA